MMVYLQMIEGGHNRRRFALLYDTYRGLMFRVARRLLHSDADAEDAVHEAFVALARNFSKINEIDCPQTRAYVVITVERKALDMLRSHSRHEAEELDEEVHGVEIAPPNDHGLADALAALAPQYREVLLLRYYNGYSARELAAYFEVSHAAMKKMLARAKAALRAKLEEGEVPYDDGYSVR